MEMDVGKEQVDYSEDVYVETDILVSSILKFSCSSQENHGNSMGVY